MESRSQALSRKARDLGTKSLQLCSQSSDLRTKSKNLIEKIKRSDASGKKNQPLTDLRKSRLANGQHPQRWL